jgi:serine/threonine-protein kinase
MELLDGEDLDTRLRRGPLSAAELHKIMSEVCRALSKAHALGIVHRDLKPANIFIVKDGDHETTKVLDFGIAKTRSNELGGSTTKTGAMLGTPYYMSPEQAQGTKAVDFRSDLWSLAVIAFYSLTGRLPFQSDALGDLLMRIIVGPIPVPSQMGSVPPGFDRWWFKAASRDVAERFQSAKEFSDSLALACGVSQVSGIVDQSPVHIKPGVLAADQPTQSDTALAIPLTKPLGPSAAGSPGGATPPPLSRSLTAEAPVIPTSRTGLIVAIAIGAVLFATALMGVGWLAFREHENPAHASASATSSAPSAPSGTTTAAAPSASTTPASSDSASAGAPADATTPVASSTPTRGAGHAGGTSATGDHGKPTPTTTKPSTPTGTPAKPASPSKTADASVLGF